MAKWIKQDPIYLQKSKLLQARNLGCSAVSNWINHIRMRHLGTVQIRIFSIGRIRCDTTTREFIDRY